MSSREAISNPRNSLLNEIYEDIQKVYLSDDRPWVIGYSGGKDSTLAAMVVFEAIKRLSPKDRKKEIHIVSSDTMVENPLIIHYLERNMSMMEIFATESNLPIQSKIVAPEVSETFWSLLLGKGYPSPRQTFRWCTHRLKIKPIDKYINDIAVQHGSVVVVLGVRNSESISRKASITKHSVAGKRLKIHETNQNAFTYAPIEHLTTDDVWACLINTHSPWGFDNNLLLSLYRDASDESECPVQQDLNAPSCGQSRFGCWVCTVVSQDKSLSGFIQNDYDELRPLLRFRNFLASVRENPEYRQSHRTNGSIYYLGSEQERRGFGPFSLEGRIKLMRELLKTEVAFNKDLKESTDNQFTIDKNTYFPLITMEELHHIRHLWIEHGDWQDTLPKLYEEITGKEFYAGYVNHPFINKEDYDLLFELCNAEDVDPDILKSMITLENEYIGMSYRADIFKKIDRILNQDIVHEELFELYRRDNHATGRTEN